MFDVVPRADPYAIAFSAIAEHQCKAHEIWSGRDQSATTRPPATPISGFEFVFPNERAIFGVCVHLGQDGRIRDDIGVARGPHPERRKDALLEKVGVGHP